MLMALTIPEDSQNHQEKEQTDARRENQIISLIMKAGTLV